VWDGVVSELSVEGSRALEMRVNLWARGI